MMLSEFATKLNEIMKENDCTQKQLANILKTSQQTVSRWLNNVNEPDLDTIILICKIFDITPNELLGYDEISQKEIENYINFLEK